MKNDDAMSQTLTIGLILLMVIGLSVAITGVFFGESYLQKKSAYISADISQLTPLEKNVISLSHKAGDSVSLASNAELYSMDVFVDTPSGSYLLSPPPGVDTFKPGTSLYIYNNTGGYVMTNDRSVATAADSLVPTQKLGVRLVDNLTHQLIGQWHTFDTDDGSAGKTITAIAPITGTLQVGSTLSAGVLTPSGATAAYLWSRSTTSGGTYTDIAGATTSTYTIVAGDIGYFFKVTATGSGQYSGTATSDAAGPAGAIPITAIGPISGTPRVGEVLVAGALTPGTATASYQWSRSTESGGTYTDITGATTSTYTPVAGDIGYYLKVTATGTGSYSGTVTSDATTGPVTAIPITAIGAISGANLQWNTPQNAGTLTPSGAAATYQWSRSSSISGTYTTISGATSTTYTPVAGDIGYYLKVTATGTGSYSGAVTSDATTGPVTAIPITAIGAISGANLQWNTPQNAGTLTPSGAVATYQWSRSSSISGTYTTISGATSSTYTPGSGDINYYLKVTATGTNGYSGTYTTEAIGPITAIPITAIGAISGTNLQWNTPQNVGTLTPSGAAATYQWSRSSSISGTYTTISGATSSTYTPGSGDINYYLKVTATGTSGYSGSQISAAAGPVIKIPITGVTISGTPRRYQTLTAVRTPTAATVTYQWSRSTSAGGTYSNIGSGGTGSTYSVKNSDVNYYIRVTITATGSGYYSGTATSAAVGPVTT
nr:hypothetical protein [uncultured Methanoregula sp.]